MEHLDGNINIKSSVYDKFKIQHQDIFDRLLKIINVKLDDPSTLIVNKIYLESQKEKIESLYDDIIEYYSAVFCKPIKVNTNSRYICIFKQILKDNGIILTSKNVTKTIDGIQQRNKYYILKYDKV